MTSDEIKAKSSELAAFYTAKANGKTLQFDVPGVGFRDAYYRDAPDLASDLSRWRVKPEPRRMWTCNSTITRDGSVADTWRSKSMKVTEWVEVLP